MSATNLAGGRPDPTVAPVVAEQVRQRAWLRRSKGPQGAPDRRLLSTADWRRPRVRWAVGITHVVLLVVLVVVGVGPLLWLAKSAITPTSDTLQQPFAVFPHGVAWSNIGTAWSSLKLSVQFLNTVWVAAGSWATQLIVATTAGFALSVLRPRYGKVLYSLVLGTLFVPAVVLLVPLYLTILDPPIIRTPLINTFWAVWLPAGASAFNVVLIKRFFDNLPREVFEAARTDGAGSWRLFVSIVLPMSKPILGVVSVFAVLASWKDYLWPLLVLRDPAMQPLSVRLPSLEAAIPLDVYLAALAITTLVPVVLFVVFQRMFLRGAGLGGAVKG